MSLSVPHTAVAPDRGRIPSIAALLLLAVLSWAAIILWTRSSTMMDAMPGRATFGGGALFAGMWVLMMVAMMLPAISPVVLLFRTIQSGRVTTGRVAVPAAAFVAGYLVIWTLFGFLADLAYLVFRAAGDRLPDASGGIPLVGGAILVLAGLYQLTPLKYACLFHCRSPLHFILHGWHEGRAGALRMGATHGAYCLGCCWGIMAVLFVVGLMNLAWMAALSVLIVLEKLAPNGVAISRLTGIGFIALGVVMAARPQMFPASGLQPAASMTMPGMAQAAMPQTTPMRSHHYYAVAGPYSVTLSVLPMGHLTVGVTDRAMGMPVSGARVSLHFSGTGAPEDTVAARAVSEANGKNAGRYSMTTGLMPGIYWVTIHVNGRLTSVHVRIS